MRANTPIFFISFRSAELDSYPVRQPRGFFKVGTVGYGTAASRIRNRSESPHTGTPACRHATSFGCVSVSVSESCFRSPPTPPHIFSCIILLSIFLAPTSCELRSRPPLFHFILFTSFVPLRLGGIPTSVVLSRTPRDGWIFLGLFSAFVSRCLMFEREGG